MVAFENIYITHVCVNTHIHTHITQYISYTYMYLLRKCGNSYAYTSYKIISSLIIILIYAQVYMLSLIHI